MAAGLRPRLRLDVPEDGTPILADGTYPENLARWDQSAPEPAAAPSAVPTGLRPQVALDVPGGGPVAFAPGATVPPVLTNPPPDTEPAPEDDLTPPPVPPPAEAEPPPAAPPPGAAAPGAVKVETERTVLSPESKAALERGQQLSGQQGAQVDKLATAQKAKTQVELEHEQGNNRVDSLTAQYQARVAEEAAIKEELAQARFREADERARQKIEAAQKGVDAANANAQKSAWADESTGYKILQVLLTYSSIKSSYTLGEDPNDSPFMRMTREAVDRDKEKKLMAVRASKEFLEAARKGPEEARQFLFDARADIEAGTARQLQITLKKAEAFKASRKLDPKLLEANIAAANAEADAKVLETQQGLVQRDLQRGALLDKKVTTTAAPLTAAQMKAAGGGGHPLFDLDGNQVGVTPNLKLSNDAAEKRAGALDSKRIGEQLAAHIREYGMEVLPGGGKSDRDAIVRDLVSALVKARSGTAASDKERKELTSTVMPSLVNQVLKSRGDIAGSVEKFVAREVGRYHNFIESSAADPKQARALLRQDQPAGGGAAAEKIQAAIVKAAKAGDTAAVADLRARLRALGN